MATLGTKEEITPEQRQAFANAARSFGERLDGIVDKLTAAGDQVKPITVPAVAVASGSPEAQAAEIAARSESKPQSAAPPPSVDVANTEAAPLTDDQIFNKVSLFLDPKLLGPIFISEPIGRKVYVAKYPSFGELLSAERIFGEKPQTMDEALKAMFEVVGELQTSVIGWLFVNEPGLELIKQHPDDVTKWPKLREFNSLASRDPRVQLEIPLLWEQYIKWKQLVTPTDDELEKYYGLKS